MWNGRPSRLRATVVGLAAGAWVLNFLAPLFGHGLTADPGLGVAFFGVIGAAIAIPYTDQERRRLEDKVDDRRKQRETAQAKLRAEVKAELEAEQARQQDGHGDAAG